MVTPWMTRGNALNYMKDTPAADKYNLVSKANIVLKVYRPLSIDKRYRERIAISSFSTTYRGTWRPPLCEF